MKVIVSLFVALGLAMPTFAADQTTFDWSACKPEIQKFCNDEKGSEAIYGCLQKHDAELSKTCDATHEKFEKLTDKKK